MTDGDSTDSPVRAVVNEARESAAAALELLANETRLAILFALWEMTDPFAADDADPLRDEPVSFSDLRNRVGLKDSGQFNYHLDQLTEQYVRRYEDGYTLTTGGHELVRAILAGTGLDDVSIEPTEIEHPCPKCGAEPTEVTFSDDRLFQICNDCEGYFSIAEDHPDGLLGGGAFPVAGIRNRSMSQAWAVKNADLILELPKILNGICTDCAGVVDKEVHVCTDHDLDPNGVCPECARNEKAVLRSICVVCKSPKITSLRLAALWQPSVMSLYHDNGVELDFSSLEGVNEIKQLYHEQDLQVLSEDPPRVQVQVVLGDDELDLTFDETATVIAMDRSG